MRLKISTFFVVFFAIIFGFFLAHRWSMKKLKDEAPQFTELKLTLSTRDNSGTPIKNVRVSILMPHERFLGATNKYGVFEGSVMVPQGKVAIVKAQSKDFLMQKDVLVPRLKKFHARIVLDPSEAASGQMQLVSSQDDQRRQPYPRVNFKVDSKRARDEMQLQGLMDFIRVAAARSPEIFELKDEVNFVLRPLWNSKYYAEVLAYSRHNELKGSFLVPLEKASQTSISAALRQMWYSKLPAQTLAVLSVLNDDGRQLRGYFNGLPLARVPMAGLVNFEQRYAFKGSTQSGMLAVTGDQYPLIQTRITTDEFIRGIKWTVPKLDLSRK